MMLSNYETSGMANALPTVHTTRQKNISTIVLFCFGKQHLLFNSFAVLGSCAVPFRSVFIDLHARIAAKL